MRISDCLQVRRFKVGIAFEFKNFVLSFNTLDLLIQVSAYTYSCIYAVNYILNQIHWAEARCHLPKQYVDVYTNFRGFLQEIADKLRERQQCNSERRGSAFKFVLT